MAVAGDRICPGCHRLATSLSRSLVVVFLWPRVSLDQRRLEFADFPNFPGSLQPYPHPARFDVLRFADPACSRTADKLGSHHGDRDRSDLGIDREYGHGDPTLSGCDSGSRLPGRHGDEFPGRHPVLRHWLYDSSQAWLAAVPGVVLL